MLEILDFSVRKNSSKGKLVLHPVGKKLIDSPRIKENDFFLRNRSEFVRVKNNDDSHHTKNQRGLERVNKEKFHQKGKDHPTPRSVEIGQKNYWFAFTIHRILNCFNC